MERPRYLDKNCGDEGLIRVGLIRGLYKEREENLWAQTTLLGYLATKETLAAEFILLLPSWNIAEIQVRFTPCPLHFRVQSCSNFWPDGSASPLLPHCQVAFCSLQQLLNPTADPNPSQQCICHFSLSHLCPLQFFFCFSCLSLFSCLLLLLYTFWCLNNKVDRLDITLASKWMTCRAHTTWSQ